MRVSMVFGLLFVSIMPVWVMKLNNYGQNIDYRQKTPARAEPKNLSGLRRYRCANGINFNFAKCKSFFFVCAEAKNIRAITQIIVTYQGDWQGSSAVALDLNLVSANFLQR